MAPEYLMRMIEKRERMRNTRMGSDNTLLHIPQTKKKTFADRGFRITASKAYGIAFRNILERKTDWTHLRKS